MRKDYMIIGSVPTLEKCFQAGFATEQQLKNESIVYRKQLQRMFPHGDFVVRRFGHDFGSYYEVVINYEVDDSDRECNCNECNGEECDCHSTDSEKLAYHVEGNTPSEWDSESLKLKEYICN